jgi:ABC-type transporter Mla subunit MlaD
MYRLESDTLNGLLDLAKEVTGAHHKSAIARLTEELNATLDQLNETRAEARSLNEERKKLLDLLEQADPSYEGFSIASVRKA